MQLDRQYTLAELANLLAVELRLPPSMSKAAANEILISSLATLDSAQAGDVTFLSNENYTKLLATTKASAIIVLPAVVAKCVVPALVTNNPRLVLAKILALCANRANKFSVTKQRGIHPSCVIGTDCDLAADIYLGPNCVVGDRVSIEPGVVVAANVVIGNDCHLQAGCCLKANVTLYDQVTIGADSIIHSSSVIGSDGFGYAQNDTGNNSDTAGNWVKLPHLGGVKIGAKVEIGSNTSVDRGLLSDTIIGDGVIIDNLVQIGHNVIIGANTAIAGCTGIAGSTTIGKNCLIGGAANIKGHITIGDEVVITAASSVNRSLTKGIYSSGFPAKDAVTWRKNVARFNNLDSMAKRLSRLEQINNELQKIQEL